MKIYKNLESGNVNINEIENEEENPEQEDINEIDELNDNMNQENNNEINAQNENNVQNNIQNENELNDNIIQENNNEINEQNENNEQINNIIQNDNNQNENIEQNNIQNDNNENENIIQENNNELNNQNDNIDQNNIQNENNQENQENQENDITIFIKRNLEKLRKSIEQSSNKAFEKIFKKRYDIYLDKLRAEQSEKNRQYQDNTNILDTYNAEKNFRDKLFPYFKNSYFKIFFCIILKLL